MDAYPGETRNKEIYTHEAPWNIYAMNWSVRPDQRFRLAFGSFIHDFNNKVQVIQLNEETGRFDEKGSFEHNYPPTKLMWLPDKVGNSPDLLASSGDYLRLWEVGDGTVKQKCLLNNSHNSEFCAPLTSFDWNETNPSIIGTSSIDTTCTIWDLNQQKPITQLIAHDKEVFDLAFARGTDVFVSVGADGSVRMFDLRALEHSTIIYESADMSALLRLAWNKHDDYYLATITMDGSKVIILDIRVPSQPAAELFGHQASINALSWAPHSACHICTGGEDKQALIWDIGVVSKQVEEPILAYSAEEEVNQLQWSSAQPDWIAITLNSKLQILRV